MHVLLTCKYKKDWMKNYLEKGGDTIIPIIGLGWWYSLCPMSGLKTRSHGQHEKHLAQRSLHPCHSLSLSAVCPGKL